MQPSASWYGALFAPHFDAASLAAEVGEALEIVREIRAEIDGLSSWINFPLFNKTGDHWDLSLGRYEGAASPTEYADRLPYSAKIVRDLAAEGWDLEYARIAVLLGRDVLRSHVDMYTSVRFVVPLNEHADFRHVFDRYCVSMRVGELWGIDPDTCHGAANIGFEGSRVALLVDARPETSRRPDWFRTELQIPADRQLQRKPWTDQARTEVRQMARARKIVRGIEAAEREWFFVPFEYDITPRQAYDELILFCRFMVADDSKNATTWEARADHWTKHNCICVLQ
jgi:hypothetical protein